MSKIDLDEIKKQLQSEADSIDLLYSELMGIKKNLRADRLKNSFQSEAKKAINKHLSDITEDSEIPKK